jgi:glyoxylase-like metal-dependent hydrolase (beta-lactamase superfamily II)
MSFLDRRGFIRSSAAALAGACLVPVRVRGRESAPGGEGPCGALFSTPGFYRFSLGDLGITVLNDGSGRLPSEIFAVNVEPGPREAYFRSRMVPLDGHPIEICPVLIETGTRRILVDAGMGPGAAATSLAGRLDRALAVVGVAPDDVDLVIVTHAHPDHHGGLLHSDGTTPVFPRAEVLLSDVELDFWRREDLAERSPDWMVPLVPGIQRVLGALDGRLRPVRADEDLGEGIRTLATPGHTPGHMGLALEGGGKELLLAGDALVSTHMNFEHPEWHFLYDLEPERAGDTRRRLLDRSAVDGTLLLGYHFPFPGLGYALRDGGAFRWHPAAWNVLP